MKLCPYIERLIERYCIDNKLGACYKSSSDITYHGVIIYDLLGLRSKSDVDIADWRVVKGNPDASSKCSVAEWACWTSVTSAFFHSSRLEDKGPTSVWAKVSQTYHCQESSPGRSWQNLRRSRDRGRRVPYSSGTSTTTGGNKTCLCLVLSWRQRNRYLGCCRLWWWQFGSSRWAQGCAADSGHTVCICCHSCRWIRRYMGSCRLWRGQFVSSRSAQGRATDSGHRYCICCASSRWIRCYLGACRLWGWQNKARKRKNKAII